MIVFLSHFYSPHIGGVEKHIQEVSSVFVKNGYQIVVITQKHKNSLLAKEKIENVEVYRFSFPQIKILGLFTIWIRLFKYFWLFARAEVIHIHDVFIWFLPFRIIFFWKKVILTIHGWEGQYPIPWKNIILKRLSASLSTKTICVGQYLKKYYKVKAYKVTHGGINKPTHNSAKDSKLILYLGRLDADTGINNFIAASKKLNGYKFEFCGDGQFAKACKKVGKVHGFVEPSKYLARASICFASGYLSVLEALSYRCKVIVNYDNPLRRDMFLDSPLKKYIFVTQTASDIQNAIKSKNKKGGFKYAMSQSWLRVAKLYKGVYNCVI